MQQPHTPDADSTSSCAPNLKGQPSVRQSSPRTEVLSLLLQAGVQQQAK